MPRLRMDQLMNFAWKFMLPMSLINIFVAGVWRFTDDAAKGGMELPLVVRWLVCLALLFVPYLVLGRAFKPKTSKRVYRYAS